HQRPDILNPVLKIHSYNPPSLSPGYIFLSTWSSEETSDIQNSPYIFSNDGVSPKKSILQFPIPHLLQRHENSIRQGHIALFDDRYRLLRVISAPDGGGAVDFHEFRLFDDGKTAVVVGLRAMQGDLSQFGIREGVGWVLDSVFWVVDLEKDNKVRFEWRASEHVGFGESVLGPSLHRFAGMSWKYAYDFFHINSVDRFKNGDFLISARHTDTLYRIDGRDGSIVWRLGSKNSSFQLLDFNFSAQHDARILEESDGKVVVSLFDNAYNGKRTTSNSSSAIVFEVDTKANESRLLKQFFPTIKGLAQNQGSMQNLPDGHTLVSWGLIAEFSEFDQQGKTVLDVAFAETTTRAYRVRKFDWIGRPDESEIALYLYARTNSSSVYFWMSWNGATEVRKWRMLREDGRVLDTCDWEGFETGFDVETFVSSGYVEAVAEDGKTLGRSKVVKTFVPPESMAKVCGDMHCMMQVFPSKATAVKDSAKGRKRGLLLSSCNTAWDMTWLSMVSGVLIGFLASRVRWSTIINIRIITALLERFRVG
ncbi:uncharacterized protein MYCFIDRAFT_37693, partial [Pseudocercospora fijiensis CIRAD86]